MAEQLPPSSYPLDFESLIRFRTWRCDINGRDPQHIFQCCGEHLASQHLRRPPIVKEGNQYKLAYSDVPCFELNRAAHCPNGDRCEYAHSTSETLFHPLRYLVSSCKNPSHENPRHTWCGYHHTPTEREAGDAIREETARRLNCQVADLSSLFHHHEAERIDANLIEAAREPSPKPQAPEPQNGSQNASPPREKEPPPIDREPIREESRDREHFQHREHHSRRFDEERDSDGRSRRTTVCQYFIKSSCRYGLNCNYLHAREKKYYADLPSLSTHTLQRMFRDINIQLELGLETIRTAASELNSMFARPPSEFHGNNLAHSPLREALFGVILNFYVAYKRKFLSAWRASRVIKGFCSFFAFANYSQDEQQIVKSAYFTIVDHTDTAFPPEYLANPTSYDELYTMVRNGTFRDRPLESKDEPRSEKRASSPKHDDRERLERERQDRERQERDREDRERQERDRLERDRLERELLERERLERDRLERERLERDRLDRERLERDRESRRDDWDRNPPTSRDSGTREWDRDARASNEPPRRDDRPAPTDWDRERNPLRDDRPPANDWDRDLRRDLPSARRDDLSSKWDPLSKRQRSPSFSALEQPKRFLRDTSPQRSPRRDAEFYGWMTDTINLTGKSSRELSLAFYRELEEWNLKNLQLSQEFQDFAEKVKTQAVRQMNLLENLKRLIEKTRSESQYSDSSSDALLSKMKQYLQSQPSWERT